MMILIGSASLPGVPFILEAELAGPFDWHGFGPIIWTAVTFVLLYVVLKRMAWGPLQQALDKREHSLRETIEAADRAKVEASELLQKYKKQLDEAREEAIAIIEEGKADAVRLKDRILQEANEEKTRIVDRTKREIELAKDAALHEVTDRAIGVALHVAEEILKKEISEAEHKALIASAVGAFEERAERQHLLGRSA